MKDINMKIFDVTLPTSMNNFLNYSSTIKGKSPRTIVGYKTDLVLFFKFLKLYRGLAPQNMDFNEICISDVDDKLIATITLGDLVSFITYAENQRDNNEHARARKISSLRSFFKYLCDKEKTLSENPAKELDLPKLSKKNPIYLTLDEAKSLLNAVEGKNYSRDYAILTLFLNCGLRLSELCSIDVSRIKEDTLTVLGKGNKERTIYLNKACLEALSTYMNHRNKLIDKIDLKSKDALFISNKMNRISQRAVERLVEKYVVKAGLDKEKYSPHKLRHTAATLMYKHGEVDIRSIQEILGHESISTTQIYTHLDDEQLRQAVKSNPLSKE